MRPGNGAPLIPEARVDDLNLRDRMDRQVWEERLAALGSTRIVQARERLMRMGVIDAEGRLLMRDLPPDMAPLSDSSVDTG